MSKNRIKVPGLAPPATREEMERLAGEIADLKILQQDYTTQMNSGIADVRVRYEAIFAELDTELEGMMERARAWADANPSTFGKARSIAMTHALVGYRTGQPQLKTLSGYTWHRVLEKLQTLGAWAACYIRTKAEIDKQGLLAARESLGAEQLRQIGVRVLQEETFFVDPKLQEVEKRAVV
jgi:phage host-nuclease inhibitor protein Gam